MDLHELKKALAGFCIAGLLSGAGLGLAGCGTPASGWGGNDDAGSVESPRQQPGSGWGAQDDSAVGTEPDQKSPGTSGWGASQ